MRETAWSRCRCGDSRCRCRSSRPPPRVIGSRAANDWANPGVSVTPPSSFCTAAGSRVERVVSAARRASACRRRVRARRCAGRLAGGDADACERQRRGWDRRRSTGACCRASPRASCRRTALPCGHPCCLRLGHGLRVELGADRRHDVVVSRHERLRGRDRLRLVGRGHADVDSDRGGGRRAQRQLDARDPGGRRRWSATCPGCRRPRRPRRRRGLNVVGEQRVPERVKPSWRCRRSSWRTGRASR